MNLLFLSTLAMDCLLFSMSADSGEPLPDTSRNFGLPGAPPGFRQAFDPRTGRFFLVVDSSTEKTAADKDQKTEKTDRETVQSNDTQSDHSRAGFGKMPAVPPGFRQAFDPRTGRFFLVVDSTAEKETEKEQIKEKAKVDLSLLTPPTIAVVDQLPKGFRQVLDSQTGRFVLVVDATAEKTEKDQKTDGSSIPHEVTALLSGGGLVTLLKGLQVLSERMGWFKKNLRVTLRTEAYWLN